MKKIEKIYVLLEDNKKKYVYVLYKNFKVERFAYTKNIDSIYNNLVFNFEKQESLTEKELIANGKICNTQFTLDKFKELNKLKVNSNIYSSDNKIYNFTCNTINISSLMGILFNHFVAFDNIYTSLLPYFVPAPFLFHSAALNFTLNQRLEILKDSVDVLKKKKLNKTKLALTLFTYFISIVDFCDLPITNFISHSKDNISIEKSIEIDDISEEDYHIMMINKVFDNLLNNPYLVDDEIEIIMKLKQYYFENPYIDYQKLYSEFAEYDIRYKYMIGDKSVAGSTSDDSRIINCYPNCYNGIDKEDVIIHEVVHKSGSFSNRILNEGMTSLIVAEYFDLGLVKNSYDREVSVTKVFCELLGSDYMLEAYTTHNDIMIDDGLYNIYENYEVIDEIYNLMSMYVNSSNEDELYINYLELILFLFKNAPEEKQLTMFDKLISANSYGNAYFSDNYKVYCKTFKKAEEVLD